jgi:beta-lactam-binding protein with PASTA domain
MSRPPDEPVDPDGETVIDPEWRPGPDTHVRYDERERLEPPPRPRPTLWPWLLALLVLVLGGLGAAIYLSGDDDDESPSATSATNGTDRTTDATTGATTTGTNTGTTTAETTAVATVAVPDVVGSSASDAQDALRAAGLRANLHTVPSARPAGTVVAQNPAAGADADEGSAVRLNVSAGGTPPAPEPEPATVPDVVGLEQTEAVRALQQAGLQASVQLVPSEEPQRRVVAQAREPGASLERGDAVQINVSTGPDPPPNSAIPDVVGQGEQEARDELRAAGFRVRVVKVDAPAPAQRGRVIDQQPGGEAPDGWEITLLVGRLAG